MLFSEGDNNSFVL